MIPITQESNSLLPGRTDELNSRPEVRVLNTTRNAAALGRGQACEQWSLISTNDHISLQLNRTGCKQLTCALECFSFRHTLIEQSVELHKEGRCDHIVDMQSVPTALRAPAEEQDQQNQVHCPDHQGVCGGH